MASTEEIRTDLAEIVNEETGIDAASVQSDKSFTGDLDIEMDDPRYDEFHQIWFTVTETLKPGPRGSDTALTVDYRDFPASIIDADTGTVIYLAPSP